MTKPIKTRRSVLALSTTLGLLAVFPLGCTAPEEETATTSEVTTNPAVGVVSDSAGFYVIARETADFKPMTHKGADLRTDSGTFNWTTACKVTDADVVARTTSDVSCFIEANEYDLYFQKLEIQYNVPSTMCSYFTVEAPFFYTYPVGYGPKTVTLSTNLTTQRTTDTLNAKARQPFCAYDYSENGTYEDRPNCCLGNYTMTETFNTLPAGVTTLPANVVTKGNWGGDLSKCINGPATDLMKKNKSGWPVPEISYVAGTGLNSILTVPSPLSKALNSNIYAANYHDTTNFNVATGRPQAFAPTYVTTQIPTDASVTYTASKADYVPMTSATQPFYAFTCYDRNAEVKARIRVMVRSWDVTANLGTATAYAPSAWNSYEPAPYGAEPLHDFKIWYDFTNSTRIPGFSYTDFLTGFPQSYL